MIIIFDSSKERLYILGEGTGSHVLVAMFPAANNADSRSNGPWPEGVYDVQTLIRVTDDEDSIPNGKYGKWFLKAKDFESEAHGVIQKRTGMGIHAGRRTKTDLAGRYGIHHATMGCIRTTDEAMQYIADQWDMDPVTKILIKR